MTVFIIKNFTKPHSKSNNYGDTDSKQARNITIHLQQNGNTFPTQSLASPTSRMFIPGVRKQENDCPALPMNLHEKKRMHLQFRAKLLNREVKFERIYFLFTKIYYVIFSCPAKPVSPYFFAITPAIRPQTALSTLYIFAVLLTTVSVSIASEIYMQKIIYLDH